MAFVESVELAEFDRNHGAIRVYIKRYVSGSCPTRYLTLWTDPQDQRGRRDRSYFGFVACAIPGIRSKVYPEAIRTLSIVFSFFG